MPRNDIVLYACGPDAAGSSETPWEFEKWVESRNPDMTSAWRDNAQKPRSALWYTGASSRSRA